MANETVLKYNGNQLLFADHATDFGAAPSTAANSLLQGSQTDIQIDLTNVAASGSARQSAKSATLGATERVPWYRVDACIEFETAPTDGGTVDFYWAGSPSSTAGTGNPGGASGTDSAYTPTVGKLGQMVYIGSLTLQNTVVNIGFVGHLQPEWEYGSLVVVNNGSTNFRNTATAMDETHIVFTPMTQGPAA